MTVVMAATLLTLVFFSTGQSASNAPAAHPTSHVPESLSASSNPVVSPQTVSAEAMPGLIVVDTNNVSDLNNAINQAISGEPCPAGCVIDIRESGTFSLTETLNKISDIDHPIYPSEIILSLKYHLKFIINPTI